MYPVYFFIIALITSALDVFVCGAPIFKSLLKWLLVSSVGLQGLFAFVGHFFRANDTARKIGWKQGSPFQTEVAFSNLALGVLGILSYWFIGYFWLATIISRTVFSFGAAYTHLLDIKQNKNFKKYNAGIILWGSCIALPILIWAVFIIHLLYPAL
ncbi:MAG: hypothetical protein NTV32_10440 [Gammaproteobacteria bacterium]|nr:hypothetical protein [Gammaproteobacteria bacterium]